AAVVIDLPRHYVTRAAVIQAPRLRFGSANVSGGLETALVAFAASRRLACACRASAAVVSWKLVSARACVAGVRAVAPDTVVATCAWARVGPPRLVGLRVAVATRIGRIRSAIRDARVVDSARARLECVGARALITLIGRAGYAVVAVSIVDAGALFPYGRRTRTRARTVAAVVRSAGLAVVTRRIDSDGPVVARRRWVAHHAGV